MKLLFLILALSSMAINCVCEDQPRTQANTNGVNFREPFTLKLHVDKEHFYEQSFQRIPYVFKDDVYLFKGDAFGIDLKITNGVIQGVSYQSDTNKAAVSLHFTQEIKTNGEAMMLLVIENHTKQELFIDALMTVPKAKRPNKTTILPVKPGLVGYESWPHPIVQLVLRNIRLTEKTDAEPGVAPKERQSIHSETNQPSSTNSSGR